MVVCVQRGEMLAMTSEATRLRGGRAGGRGAARLTSHAGVDLLGRLAEGGVAEDDGVFAGLRGVDDPGCVGCSHERRSLFYRTPKSKRSQCPIWVQFVWCCVLEKHCCC